MATSTWRRIRHLVGAFCAAALLAGTVGLASAEAAPQTTKTTAGSSSAVSGIPCAYTEDGVAYPPNCTP
ncbi:hypothetical protein ACFV80_41210 [Streptomyces sp. NPDC059862]|uniref:hypothetical protein n=1 Tax=Streptomyces sp. NPDC059862 TaxID=3346975 RepID=UPI003646FA52